MDKKTLANPESIFAGLLILDPPEAFEFAIKAGRLSEDPAASNFAGDYMYMNSGMVTRWFRKPVREDYFKHRDFRSYLTVRRPA